MLWQRRATQMTAASCSEPPQGFADTVEPGDRHAYVPDATADVAYTSTLGAPAGVWLNAGLGEDVAGLPKERPRRATLVLPANAARLLEVVSTADQPADYEITTTIRHPDHGPPSGAYRRGARPAAAIRGTSHLLVVGRDGRTLPPPPEQDPVGGPHGRQPHLEPREPDQAVRRVHRPHPRTDPGAPRRQRHRLHAPSLRGD